MHSRIAHPPRRHPPGIINRTRAPPLRHERNRLLPTRHPRIHRIDQHALPPPRPIPAPYRLHHLRHQHLRPAAQIHNQHTHTSIPTQRRQRHLRGDACRSGGWEVGFAVRGEPAEFVAVPTRDGLRDEDVGHDVPAAGLPGGKVARGAGVGIEVREAEDVADFVDRGGGGLRVAPLAEGDPEADFSAGDGDAGAGRAGAEGAGAEDAADLGRDDHDEGVGGEVDFGLGVEGEGGGDVGAVVGVGLEGGAFEVGGHAAPVEVGADVDGEVELVERLFEEGLCDAAVAGEELAGGEGAFARLGGGVCEVDKDHDCAKLAEGFGVDGVVGWAFVEGVWRYWSQGGQWDGFDDGAEFGQVPVLAGMVVAIEESLLGV